MLEPSLKVFVRGIFFVYATFLKASEKFTQMSHLIIVLTDDTFLLDTKLKSLRQMEHENEKILSAKGELNEENASAYEKLRKAYDQLYRGISG